jgi:hypothetical protein
MPIHEYCNEERRECEEVIFLHGDEVPEVWHGKRRYISAPTIKFVGAFSGGTPQRHISQRHVEKGSGQKVVEDGMEEDVKRNAAERYKKQDKERSDFIASELESYNV